MAKVFNALSKAEDDFDRAEALARIIKLGPAGKDRVEIVEPYLAAEDAEVRSVALRAYCSLMEAGAATKVRSALKDEAEMVRATAVKCWRKLKLDTPADIKDLLYDDEASVQREVLLTYKEGADAATLTAIKESLSDFAPSAAKVALEILLARKAEVDGLPEAVSELMDHQSPSVRRATIRDVGSASYKSPVVAKKLARLLWDDPDDQVRGAAHRLLGAWAGADAPAFDPEAETDARRKAAEVWTHWIEANATRFGG